MHEERRAVVRPGTVIGDAYRVVRRIGEGAMGGIYEARQLRLDKRVAIKVLARELAANGAALLRFHREAEITSQLGHPNIITVFDFGTTDQGQPYLVMEYLEGEDLADRLERVKILPVPAALRITTQVASALAETHAKGVIHRDLKPANVFLSQIQGEDFAKVLDFGISKVRAATTTLTNASTLMGTPMYMAPEQAKGETELDHWTDQWALACITFEMLSGRPPFVGGDTAALLYQVVHEEPPPLSQINNNLPAALDPVLRRALTKNQNERFPHVTAFARALEAAANGQPLAADVARNTGAFFPASSPAPFDAAASLAGGAEAFAPRPPKRGSPKLVLLGGIAMTLVAGAWLFREPLRRLSPTPPVTAAPAVNTPPIQATAPTTPEGVAPGQPSVEPLPSAAATADAAPAKADDEPAATAEDTVSAPAKVTTVIKKDSVRRRPGRRAAAKRVAASAAAPGETPPPTAPVKRKLINDL